MKNKTILCKDRNIWRKWLQKNYRSKEAIWLVYYKKHTKKPSVAYEDAVEEAICFGWIDGQIKRIDDEKYMQRYSPRTSKSRWSVINIGRAKKMVAQGKMTKHGQNIFENGIKGQEKVPSSKNFTIPPYLKSAIVKNKQAWNNFQAFAPSSKLVYVYWVTSAKTTETRNKRIKKTIELLAQNKKYGEK